LKIQIDCTGTRVYLLIAPVHVFTSWLHRYTCLPLDCTGTRVQLLIAPVHVYTTFVRVACTGTWFYQPCLDQWEIAFNVGRAQE